MANFVFQSSVVSRRGDLFQARSCVGFLLLAWFVFVVGPLSSQGVEDFDRHIRNFAAKTPRDKIEASLRVVRDAGTNAFPALIKHLQDKRPAELSFFGGDQIGEPSIGSACFDLLQTQIEGNWPKGFRDYYILSPTTVRGWLAQHRGLALRELRIEAARQSLERAEADISVKGKSDFHDRTLKFLRENLAEAKRSPN